MKNASNATVAVTTIGNATPSRESAERERRRYSRKAARERAEAERERREIRRDLRAAGLL